MSASTEFRSPRTFAPLLHVVTLECKDAEHADRCLTALREHGRPDALAYGCVSYEFGPRVDSPSTIQIVERWHRWEDLDALLQERVVPALPLYDALLASPFDPSRHTARTELV
jgi:quinol monooxygenase YgiN